MSQSPEREMRIKETEVLEVEDFIHDVKERGKKLKNESHDVKKKRGKKLKKESAEDLEVEKYIENLYLI